MVLLVRQSCPRTLTPPGGGARRSHPARPAHRRVMHAKALADDSFELSKYTEASIAEVRAEANSSNAIVLRLKNGLNHVLSVYVGDNECGALVQEINKLPLSRPGTYDLMRTLVEAMGHRVTKVRISSLVGSTYYAKVHCRPAGACAPNGGEIELDARPSDAMNLAIRFGAPIYVNNAVAARMAEPAPPPGLRAAAAAAGGGAAAAAARGESAHDIARTCREELLHYADPTIMHKLQLGLAVAEDRFEEATKLRDEIERLLARDRASSLSVAMETALEDARFEEAARLRDALRALRRAQGGAGAAPRLPDVVDL